jgi:Outer membrane lipoprotein involved in outer membrane biogenesis
MRKLIFLTVCVSLFLLTACSKTDSTPTSLTNTSWKCSTSGSTQVLKFTSATAGTYTVNSSSVSFTYTYSSPNVSITESNGDKLDGDFTSTTTLEIIQSNSPTAALKFTKQ